MTIPRTPHHPPPSLDVALIKAVHQLRAGRPVLIMDDTNRENEGDVVLAAQYATEHWIGWTIRHTSGLLCVPMPDDVADRLALPLMVADNQDPRQTAYTVTVDAREGVTTGISAADRALTARLLADSTTTAHDLVRPGHLLPLRSQPHGVADRPGHTEAAVDLCRIAGLAPVAVIAEVTCDDGTMMRGPEIAELAKRYDLATLRVADLVQWRRDRMTAGLPLTLDERGFESTQSYPASGAKGVSSDDSDMGTVSPMNVGASLSAHSDRVVRVATSRLPTRFGEFTVYAYRDHWTGADHLAIVADSLSSLPLTPTPPTLVRVHSECLTGDSLGSTRCDCGAQLSASLQAINKDGGMVVYLRGQEGRGIGLLAKIAAYSLQDAGADTVDANIHLGLPVDAREYGAAASILRDMHVTSVRLLTNNPAKVAGLTMHGITIIEQVPLLFGSSEAATYLATKRDRLGHVLPPASAATSTRNHHESEGQR
ncbi:MAG: GTP cyclohydrolase II [Actinomycetota bacterium]